MTTPRIESSSSHLHSISSASDFAKPAASSQQATEDGLAVLDLVQEYAGELADDFYEQTVGRVVDAGEAVARNAQCFVEVDDAIRGLHNGESAVVQLGGGLSAHKGIGAGVDATSSMSVAMENDVFEARLEVGGRAAVGVGAEIAKEGIAADISLGKGARIIARGKGEEARKELAIIADITNPALAAETLQNSQHLEVVRLEARRSSGLFAGAGVVAAASARLETSGWVGVDFQEGTPAGGFLRSEASMQYELATPRMQLQSSEDEVAVLRLANGALGLGVASPGDALAALAAEGISPGVVLQAQGTLASEVRAGRDGLQHDFELKVRLRAGASLYESTHKATVAPGTLDAKQLAQVSSAKTTDEFVHLLREAGVKVESSAKKVSFEGTDISTPVGGLRCGVERTSVWQLSAGAR